MDVKLANDLAVTIQHARTVFIGTSDEALLCELLDILEEDRHTIVTVEDGSQILQMIITHQPDILVLSPELPGASGFDVCASLQQLPETDRIPVLMVLDEEDEALIEMAYSAGAIEYVPRPLRPVVVRHRVNGLLQIRRMRGTLSEKEERYRIISSIISDYAYAYRVQPDGRLIKEWSTLAFETITGYKPADLSGEGWEQLIHPDDIPLTLERYHRLMRGERDVTEFRIITKNGEIKWLRDYGQPVWGKEENRVVRIYGAAQDVTERRHNEQMMRERNEELDAFAHTVAHDLKNPISSMMGFASLVLNYYDRMTDDKIKEYLDLIMESGYKLKRIINSLLLLAGVNRLEKLELESLEMSEIIEGAKSRMRNIIDELQAEIIEPDEWPEAIGYAPWVEEVWANYLSNALKYGGHPPRIEFGYDSPHNGCVRFWIRDNGSGLSEEDQQVVFMPFTRVSQAKIEGHGLGLSVVHRIVERLGGQVGVESSIGQGSVFSFTLPGPR